MPSRVPILESTTFSHKQAGDPISYSSIIFRPSDITPHNYLLPSNADRELSMISDSWGSILTDFVEFFRFMRKDGESMADYFDRMKTIGNVLVEMGLIMPIII
jgi:hypothetical protein